MAGMVLHPARRVANRIGHHCNLDDLDHPTDSGKTIGVIAAAIIQRNQAISRRYELDKVATAHEEIGRGTEAKVFQNNS